MDTDNRPPLFPSWKGWYILVISVLFTLIGLFYWLTQTYA